MFLSSFGRVFRFEVAKAIRARLTWVTLLLPALLTVASVSVAEAVRRAEQFASADLTGIQSAYVGFSRGASNGFVLGGILLLFYASMLVSNEGSLKTFKVTMLRPHSRAAWIFAKLALLLVIALGLVVSVTGSALASAALIADYVDIAEEGYVLYEASSMARECGLAVLLVAPPLLALASFGLLISTMTDHAGIATSACIGIYVFLEALKSSIAGSRLYLFNTFMPSLLDTSYFAALRGLAEGLSDAGWDESVFTYNLVTPLVSALVFTALTARIFTRRDFVV